MIAYNKRFIFLVTVLAAMACSSGCTNVLGFSTATKFALDVSQRADETIDVSLGYDRVEVASIPVPENQDAKSIVGQNGDAYSVLGTFKVKYGNPFSLKPFEITQLFATGMAARNVAVSPALQRYFGEQTGTIVKKNSGDQ